MIQNSSNRFSRVGFSEDSDKSSWIELGAAGGFEKSSCAKLLKSMIKYN